MAYDPRRWLNYDTLDDQNNGDQNYYQKQEPEDQYRSFDYQPTTTSNTYKTQDFYNPTPDPENIYTPSFNGNAYQQPNNGSIVEKKRKVDEYDPMAPSFSGSSTNQPPTPKKEQPDPRKLGHFISMLQKMIRPIPYDYKKMLPYDIICQLAHAMLDGTVFEIANGLKDIQKITEKSLHAKRSKLVNEHKAMKQEIKKRHKTEIEHSQSRPHQILVYEKKHAEELKIFNERVDKELTQMDQKIVLDLDQQISDQQVTLERAGLPLFFITNNPQEIRIQMYILEFIVGLSNSHTKPS
ncbi:protein DGCR6-like [Clytia hemisphaerica]|uniref:protein DGCR6-like n=1 Tax=Clytia hemisphaerica TaxID=252671 RepID=UPI0034D57EF6